MQASEIFKKRLRERLRALGMTHEDLAKILGLKTATVSGYLAEKAEPNPTASTLIEFSRALKTTPNYLLGFDDERPEPRKPTELEIAVHLFDMFEGMNDHRNQKAVDLFKKALTASDAQLDIWLRDFDAMKDELLSDPDARSRS